jgi:putative transcriptional regulator
VRTAREVVESLPNGHGDAGRTTRVLLVREEFGLSLRAVARETGISPAEVSRIERGLSEPGVHIAMKLAKFYETTVEQLFGDEN